MKDLVLGLAFIALGITVWVIASGFPAVPGMHYGANLFPNIIAAGMVIGGALLSFCALREMRQTPAGEACVSSSTRPSLGLVLPGLMVVAYIYLSDLLGAALTMLLIMLVLLFQGGVRWLPALLVSVASAAVISFSFGHLLHVPLPTGPFGF